MKKYISCILAVVILLSVICLTGCDYDLGLSMSYQEENEDVQLTFEAVFYDNQGNNYVTFKGNSFNITPNKQKQWGYNTNGSWTSFYETSSVVSIEIDGHFVQSCGSTVIFKDTRLEIEPLDADIGTLNSSDKSGYATNTDGSVFKDYFALTHWWYDTHENGQGGNKLVLIQSQDGYNIGVIEGDDIYWEVAEELPKTTLLKVDDKPLYIHRCNFTIIDTALFNNVVMPKENK